MFYIPFNYYSISLVIGAFTALISGFIVISRDYKRPENQAWFALTMCTAIWSTGYFYMTIANSHAQGLLGNWILHYAAIFIPLFYYLLVLIITDTVDKHKIKFSIYTVIAFLFTLVNLATPFVADVIPKVGFNFAPVPGYLYIYFFLYFVFLVVDGLITTAIKAYYEKDRSKRLRFVYTIIFTIAASVGGGSVFATTFLTVIPPYPLILFSIYPAISGYAILRYQLFDVKVVTAQIFTFTLWIFIFVRVLSSETFKEQVANLILLIVTMALGLLLNRSIKREVRQRERIELLAKDLQKANDRLTDLDRQKSEFVSFATHQLRAPLTAMKGYASLILEGDMGAITDATKEAIGRIFESTKTLTNIVDDYLNITRIELGSMKYAFETISLKGLIEDVIAELKPNIEKSKLDFSFNVDMPAANYRVTADRDKLKQVIANLIDNSMKYTPSGWVKVRLDMDKARHKFLFTVSDSGIGIAPETIPLLFQKFGRAHNANKVNIKGTGLGLFVAKEILNAHNASIKVESPGEGKGSVFTVEFEPFAKA